MSSSLQRRFLAVAFVLAPLIPVVPVGLQTAVAISPDIVISQVYGGGGNAGAPYRTTSSSCSTAARRPCRLTGWSVQYASATGTGNFGANPVTVLSGSLAPGQYYLVQQAPAE